MAQAAGESKYCLKCPVCPQSIQSVNESFQMNFTDDRVFMDWQDPRMRDLLRRNRFVLGE